MSTATFSREPGIALVPQSGRRPLSLSAGIAPSNAADLTIHRITKTHHGRTLLMLGHAAEHLGNSSRFASTATPGAEDEEAIHILMDLSRRIFDEYAEGVGGRRRVEELVLRCVTRLLN